MNLVPIIVEFSFSGSECSGDIVHAIMYESPEAFYITFEEKLKNYINECEIYEKAFKEWEPNWSKQTLLINKLHNRSYKEPNSVEKEIKEAQLEITRLHESRPNYPNFEFELAGKTFDFNDHIYTDIDYDNKKKTRTIHMPYIGTLEEWFKWRQQ